MPAYIELREYPGQKFSGKVVRTADSIDPATRTLLTEIDVPNKDGHLLPGSYAEVHFAVPVLITRMSIPVNALLFRPEGPRVAVVGPDHKVHLKAINIGRDYGTKVEILGGLDAERPDRGESGGLAGRRAGSQHQDRGRSAIVRQSFLRLGPAAAALAFFLGVVFLGGCVVGPNYHRPDVATAPAWKEQPPWRAADPKDSIPKGDWWTTFADDELNQYEAQALKANQTIEIARNQLQQARASARITQSGLFPTLNAGISAQRAQTSAFRPTTTGIPLVSPAIQTDVIDSVQPELGAGRLWRRQARR